jgi:hypothetical protein
VEGDVGGGEGLAVADGGAVLGQGVRELGEVGVGGRTGGFAGEAGLEEEAGVLELALALVGREQLLDGGAPCPRRCSRRSAL